MTTPEHPNVTRIKKLFAAFGEGNPAAKPPPSPKTLSGASPAAAASSPASTADVLKSFASSPPS